MIILTKGKQYKRQSELAELATDLSPDDLDVREENALTQEQKKTRTKEIVQKICHTQIAIIM